MRCRFVEDPRIVIGLFTHGLTTRLWNEVLKSCPSEVDEAYSIVEHMERPGDDAPVTTTTQTARAPFTRSTTTTTPSQPRPGGGNSWTTPTTSVGSAPPPRAVTTDSSLRTNAVAPPPITCFKCQGKGHRASQCPSLNLLIGLEDDAEDYTVDDDALGDDIYVVDDGLEDECLDPDVIGYIKITSAASSHSPTAPHGSTVVSIAVPSPSSGTPLSRPPSDTITGARPPSARTRAASAVAPGTSSPTAGQARIPPPTPDPVANCAFHTSIFYTYVKINGQVCKLIVDSGSCVNAVSDTMIPRLGLATHPHPTPYDVSWIDTTSLPVRLQSPVPLRISTYDDIVLCDAIPMKIGSIILGRPWLYDHDVQLAGRANTCSFMHRGRRVILAPYTAPPTARRLPPRVQHLLLTSPPELIHLHLPRRLSRS